MNMLTVYHGSTEKVETPICRFGRKNLDFGQGFYVTDIREQAITWANNMSRNRNMPPLLNRYHLDRESILKHANCKIFKAVSSPTFSIACCVRAKLPPAIMY